MVAGYSGTPLVKKLGLKAGMRAHLAGTPPAVLKELGQVVREVTQAPKGDLDFAILFSLKAIEFKRRFAAFEKRIADNGMIWVAWPKKAAKVETDMDFDVVQKTGLAGRMVDVKVSAIDDTWSGLKFVVRKENRATENQTRRREKVRR